MFKRLFSRPKTDTEATAERIYSQIVAAARQTWLYSDAGIPDTPLGRFESISLHVFLLLHRLRGAAGEPADIAQRVTDIFFTEVDHSLRELGIGDTSVPKRMKKLARMHYGRLDSYSAALDANDRDALRAALKRNIRPDLDGEWEGAGTLAGYVLASRDALLRQDGMEIMTRGPRFAENAGSRPA